MGFCMACGVETIVDYDASTGSTYCSQCGTVIEENGIVAEVTFGENSTGAAIVNGAYVGFDQTRAKAIGGRRPAGAGSVESREQTIANGRRKVQAIINALKLPDRFTDMAQRFYTLALNSNFVRGRRTNYVVAACLYIVCRREKTSHMLIDFSDLLQVNVFILGSTYLKLVKELNLTIPAIDPSLYISRFASLLEFGEETQQVASDATRLVQRFSRDWMDSGRRPAGICGACLLLAARMNNFRRSIQEIVQVVKIADVTLKKRLEEFNNTASANLSVVEFRSVWLTDGANPPAYNESLKKAGEERNDGKKQRLKMVRFSENALSRHDNAEDIDEQNLAEVEGVMGESGRKHAEMEQCEDLDPLQESEEDENVDITEGSGEQGVAPEPSSSDFNSVAAEMAAMQEAGGAGLAAEEEDQDIAGDIDVTMDEDDEESMLAGLAAAEIKEMNLPTSADIEAPSRESRAISPLPRNQGLMGNKEPPPDLRSPEERARDEAESSSIGEAIAKELSTPAFTTVMCELGEKEKKSWMIANDPKLQEKNPTWTGADPLNDLDEDELDALILHPDEVKIKERLWMEFNKDYLANVAEKHLRAELDEKPLKKRDRKKRARPRDSSTPRGATAAESTKQLLKQKKLSKKINYSALDNLLASDGIDMAGLLATSKSDKFFHEDDAQENWETASRGSCNSRASSLAPSLSSFGGVTSKSGNTIRSPGTYKQKRSRNGDDQEEAAERLKHKLKKRGRMSGIKPSKKKIALKTGGGSTLNISAEVLAAAATVGMRFVKPPDNTSARPKDVAEAGSHSNGDEYELNQKEQEAQQEEVNHEVDPPSEGETDHEEVDVETAEFRRQARQATGTGEDHDDNDWDEQ